MKNLKKVKKVQNKRKTYFNFLLIILFSVLWFYGYLRIDSAITQKNINNQKTLLEQQNKQLTLSQNKWGHEKLNAVRQLENSNRSLPWSEHIPKVIKMLEDLKSVDTSESETIVLSDFKVNLDTISLKWKVSSLPLLYINSKKRNYTSLLDRFAQLDFINDLRIQTYEKEWARDFEFVLNANVVLNDDTK